MIIQFHIPIRNHYVFSYDRFSFVLLTKYLVTFSLNVTRNGIIDLIFGQLHAIIPHANNVTVALKRAGYPLESFSRGETERSRPKSRAVRFSRVSVEYWRAQAAAERGEGAIIAGGACVSESRSLGN